MLNLTLVQSKKYFKISSIILVIFLIFLTVLIIRSIPKKNHSSEAQRQELILNLPHITKDYSIVFAPNNDQIYVNIINPPYEQNREFAIEWIKSQGFDPEKLEIVYFPLNKFKQN